MLTNLYTVDATVVVVVVAVIVVATAVTIVAGNQTATILTDSIRTKIVAHTTMQQALTTPSIATTDKCLYQRVKYSRLRHTAAGFFDFFKSCG